MILKEKYYKSNGSLKLEAGEKHESDVAFQLMRAFKDKKDILVLNDVKIIHNSDVAQIDHLIIHPFGFVIIESKSIRGEVKVNRHGEWSRSYKDVWSGMPSPIKQAELQMGVLKALIRDNTSDLLRKSLGLQMGFGARQYDIVCAISSDAIIHRDNAPKEVSSVLVKSEFLVDLLKDKIGLKSKFNLVGKLVDTRPNFNEEELDALAKFFISQDKASSVHSEPLQLRQCVQCGTVNEGELIKGRFGDYFKCKGCGKNNSVKKLNSLQS